MKRRRAFIQVRVATSHCRADGLGGQPYAIRERIAIALREKEHLSQDYNANFLAAVISQTPDGFKKTPAYIDFTFCADCNTVAGAFHDPDDWRILIEQTIRQIIHDDPDAVYVSSHAYHNRRLCGNSSKKQANSSSRLRERTAEPVAEHT